MGTRKVDVRFPGKRNLSSLGARPVHQTITMIKWIRTSRLSVKKSLSLGIGEDNAKNHSEHTIPLLLSFHADLTRSERDRPQTRVFPEGCS